MQPRRSILATVAGAGLVSLAGCSSLLGDSIEASAQEPRVSESALQTTGYRHEQTSEFEIEETLEVSDESRDVRLTNWIAVYQRGIDGIDFAPAQFSLMTSPTVTVAGRDVNPFRRMDDERLLDQLADQMGPDGIEDIQALEERDVSVLGESVPVTKYEARTEQDGIDVLLHLGHLAHEGDFLMLLGVHPEQIDETENVDALAAGTEHPV